MTDPKKPAGKLRLLYEAAPLAFVAKQAGGRASTGTEDILELQPTQLHQRVPLIIGSAEDVASSPRRLHATDVEDGCGGHMQALLQGNKRYDRMWTSAPTIVGVAPQPAAGAADDGTPGGWQSDHAGYV